MVSERLGFLVSCRRTVRCIAYVLAKATVEKGVGTKDTVRRYAQEEVN